MVHISLVGLNLFWVTEPLIYDDKGDRNQQSKSFALQIPFIPFIPVKQKGMFRASKGTVPTGIALVVRL